MSFLPNQPLPFFSSISICFTKEERIMNEKRIKLIELNKDNEKNKLS